MTHDDHVTVVSNTCYFHIRALRHIRASIPDNVANMIACSVVGARFDYYKSLLAGMSEANFAMFQCVQNTLARVLTGTRKHDRVKQEVIHITSVLSKLHWIQMKARVAFKLVCNIRQTGSPPYIASLLIDYKPIRELRSTDKHLLATSRSRLKTSERAFHHAAVAIWNTLPLTIRECGTVFSLRKHLKIHLYNIEYKSTWPIPPPPTPTNDWCTYRRGRYKFYVLTYLVIM